MVTIKIISQFHDFPPPGGQPYKMYPQRAMHHRIKSEHFQKVAPPQYSPSKYPGRHMVKARRPSQQLNNHGQVKISTNKYSLRGVIKEFIIIQEQDILKRSLKRILCRILLASSRSLLRRRPREGIRATTRTTRPTRADLPPPVVLMEALTGQIAIDA